MNGADVLLLANTGTINSPNWTAVGSQTGVSFKEANDSLDFSTKDSRAKRVQAGRYSASLSLDTLYVPNDTAYLALKTAMRAGDLILVRKEEEGVATEEANALITSMSEDAPDQAPATISIDLEIDDVWTEVGS
jgi:hypothetical protein